MRPEGGLVWSLSYPGFLDTHFKRLKRNMGLKGGFLFLRLLSS